MSDKEELAKEAVEIIKNVRDYLWCDYREMEKELRYGDNGEDLWGEEYAKQEEERLKNGWNLALDEMTDRLLWNFTPPIEDNERAEQRVINSPDLTALQADTLQYISNYLHENHESPKLDEIREHMGASSINSATQVIEALEEKGLVFRHKERRRGIRIIRTH